MHQRYLCPWRLISQISCQDYPKLIRNLEYSVTTPAPTKEYRPSVIPQTILHWLQWLPSWWVFFRKEISGLLEFADWSRWLAQRMVLGRHHLQLLRPVNRHVVWTFIASNRYWLPRGHFDQRIVFTNYRPEQIWEKCQIATFSDHCYHKRRRVESKFTSLIRSKYSICSILCWQAWRTFTSMSDWASVRVAFGFDNKMRAFLTQWFGICVTDELGIIFLKQGQISIKLHILGV